MDINQQMISEYFGVSPFLLKMLENIREFYSLNDCCIFAYFIGYFKSYKLNDNELLDIFHKYKEKEKAPDDFFEQYKNIGGVFSNYIKSKKKLEQNKPNQFNLLNSFNNINNFLNSKKSIYVDINKIDISQQKDIENKIMSKEIQEQMSNFKKCEICLEDFDILDNTNYYLNCNCIIHNVCFDNMVKSDVENNKLPVKCPNCHTPVHPNFIEDSLRNANPELFEKYDKFSMNNFISINNKEYSSCPTPGCEYLFFFQEGEFNFLCPLCNKNYCLNCKDEWHRGLTCEQYRDSRDVNKLDQQFFKFVQGAKFKMCPRCKYWVEKNQGCNHMKCRCGADFCYLCGQFMNMNMAHKCRNNI